MSGIIICHSFIKIMKEKWGNDGLMIGSEPWPFLWTEMWDNKKNKEVLWDKW
jgi:hypothetical protein